MHSAKGFRVALILYLFLVAWVVFFSREVSEERVIKLHSETILFLLGQYPDWQSDYTALHPESMVIGDILNILLFVPVGIFTEGILLSKKLKISLLWSTILGFMISFAIELIQLLTRRGWFDADDLLMNTIGAFVGGGVVLLLSWLYRKCFHKRRNNA